MNENTAMVVNENNVLQGFHNDAFGDVRGIIIDGKFWFVGTDVARALGYARANEAVTRHCKGTLKRRTPTAGGIQEMLFIPEGDVYRLIARSKLSSAERFETWVFDEVLPSIRETGSYSVQPKPMDDTEILSRAFLISQRNLKECETKIKLLTDKVEEITPAATYANDCLSSENCVSATAIAKDLGMSASRLNRILQILDVQYKRGTQWFLKAPYQNNGYAKTKTSVIYFHDGHTETQLSTVWSQKGRQFIIQTLTDNGYIRRKKPTKKALEVKVLCTDTEFNWELFQKEVNGRHLTLSDLSTITGINKQSLGYYFSGRRYPRPGTRRRICNSFGLPENYFDL